MTRSAFFQFVSRSLQSAIEAWNFDITLKVGAFLLSLATAGIGIWQYRDAKEKEYQKVLALCEIEWVVEFQFSA